MNFSKKNHDHKNKNIKVVSNRVILSVAIVATIGLTSCKDETKKETESTTTTTEISNEMAMTDMSFGVRGNCSMCKTTIEKAANSIEGVASANWDVDKKKIEVSFDGDKTDAMAIHQAIAASGYDTEKVAGNEAAYNNLPGCCKYDHEMMMNHSGENKM